MSKSPDVGTSITVSPAQLHALLTRMIPAREPILIHGAPGIGKSRIVQQVCAELDYKCYVENLVSRDPTDIGGMPMILNGAPEHVHFKIGRIIREATEPTCIFFDDVHNASPAVQAAVMQWVLDISGAVSPHVSFVLACNGMRHRAGANAIIETLKSRTTVVELEVRLQDWRDWAMRSGIEPRVVAFLSLRPELLQDFKPTADLTNSPCPRGWERVSRLYALGLPDTLQLAAFAGAVGHGAAIEFVAFDRLYSSITPPDVVLAQPDTAPIPQKLDMLCAMALALAHAVDAPRFGALGRYLERLYRTAPEAVALTLSAAIAREPTLTQCRGYIDLACSPLGRVLVGIGRA